MVLSKQKSCLLLTVVSIESQKQTPILQTKLNFVKTRNMNGFIEAKVLSFVNGSSIESQKHTPILQTKLNFVKTRNMNRTKCWSYAEFCETFTFLIENILVKSSNRTLFQHAYNTNLRR